MPSKDNWPNADRKATLLGSLTTVVAPAPVMVTPEVFSGSSSSNMRPAVPASSPKMMVPQAVRRTGSHDVRPESTMFSTRPSEILMRCRATTPAACSLQAIRWVGLLSFGHNAIWSILGPRFDAALTTLALRPFARVTRAAGLASACTAVRLALEELPRGPFYPEQLKGIVLQGLLDRLTKIEMGLGKS